MPAKPITVRQLSATSIPEDNIIRMALDVLIRESNSGKARPDGCNRHAGYRSFRSFECANASDIICAGFGSSQFGRDLWY